MTTKEIKDKYSFKAWWVKNKLLYEKAGVPEEIAHTIWRAALDNFMLAMAK